jgi:hypothetical protein
VTPDGKCEQCGTPHDRIEITIIGDRERRYAYGLPNCDCPPPLQPHCPFSGTRLDDQGRCPDVDCFMWMQIIPIPVMS